MPNPRIARAACQRAEGTVLRVTCPVCDEHVEVQVQDGDVSIITACINSCDRDSHFPREELDERAINAFTNERIGLEDHYQQLEVDAYLERRRGW